MILVLQVMNTMKIKMFIKNFRAFGILRVHQKKSKLDIARVYQIVTRNIVMSGESAAVEHLQNVLCRDQLAVSSCATTSYHTLCNTAGQTRGDH